MSTDLYITGVYRDLSFVLYDACGNESHLPGLAITLPGGTPGWGDNTNTFLVKYSSDGYAKWGTRLGGDIRSGGYSITVDPSGNVYIVGSYYDTSFVIYDACGNTSHLTGFESTNTLYGNTYVVKYNSDGLAQWATRLGGDTGSAGYGVISDSFGNVFITGYYYDTSFNIYNSNGSISNLPGLEQTNELPYGSNAFLVKYNPDGIAQWGTRIGGDDASQGKGITIDNCGNIYLVGGSTDTSFVVYNSDRSVATLPGVAYLNGIGTDTFIVKYNPDGIAQWGTRLDSGEGTISGRGITIDGCGNVYITGSIQDISIIVYNSDGSTSYLPGLDVIDNGWAFIVKYNVDGFAQWGTHLSGGFNPTGTNIIADSNGNVYISGYYATNVVDYLSLYNSDGTISNLPGLYNTNSLGEACTFVVKYNTNGYAQWGTRLGGDAGSYGGGMTVDISGNVYITGQYADISFVMYDACGNESHLPGLVSTDLYPPSATFNAYIVKYNTDGYAEWGTRLGGDIGSAGNAIATNRFSSTGSPPVDPIICFLEGSKLLCLIDGEEIYKKIEEIKKGTLIKTGKSGYKKVEMIGHSKMYNPGNKLDSKYRLYRCKKENYPELTEDLIITGCHSILVDELSAEEREGSIEYTGRIYITENKYRLIACLDKRAEPYEEEGIHTIWHLALEHQDYYMNYGCYANGLLVETTSRRMMKELSGMKLQE